MLYRTAYGTGFRANELRSLTPECFHLDQDPPTITVKAGFSKHRREDTQPIRRELAELLKVFLKGKPCGQPVFGVPEKTYKLMQADCRAAGVAYCDQEGRYADFHAWRHSFISTLAKANVSVKLAQTLARHSDPKLTLNTYSHVTLADTSAALETLPSLMPLPNNTQAARPVSIDEKAIAVQDNCWARCWAREGVESRSCTESGGVMVQQGQGEANPLNMRESCDFQGDCESAPGATRTRDLRFRKPPLYPTELRALHLMALLIITLRLNTCPSAALSTDQNR